jgi:transposase
MLMLPPSCRIYLCPQPCDMRRGYDGLYAEVRRRCDESPLSGHLFIFMSRNRTRLKILFFADGGLCLYCKRLEKGTFKLPKVEPGQTSVRLAAVDLAMLLTGIDLRHVRRQELYQPPRSLTDRPVEKIDKTLQK